LHFCHFLLFGNSLPWHPCFPSLCPLGFLSVSFCTVKSLSASMCLIK